MKLNTRHKKAPTQWACISAESTFTVTSLSVTHRTEAG